MPIWFSSVSSRREVKQKPHVPSRHPCPLPLTSALALLFMRELALRESFPTNRRAEVKGQGAEGRGFQLELGRGVAISSSPLSDARADATPFSCRFPGLRNTLHVTEVLP